MIVRFTTKAQRKQRREDLTQSRQDAKKTKKTEKERAQPQRPMASWLFVTVSCLLSSWFSLRLCGFA
jgi:hypothetical protein